MGKHHDAVKTALDALYEIRAPHDQLERVGALMREVLTSAYAAGKEDAGGTATLRDMFASAALTGRLADPNMRGSADEFARASYNYADAMLRARQG